MARYPRWLLLFLAGLLVVATGGCSDDGADDDVVDPPGDDDDVGDDDDTGDDDTGDDDTEQGPCIYTDDWLAVLPEEDALGDASGYLLDIRSLQYQHADPYLYFRLRGWEAFDCHKNSLALNVLLRAGLVEYSLTWDNVQPNPGPLQFWSSANAWQQPYDLPESMHFCPDLEDSFVIGIDPTDHLLPVEPTDFYARAAVNFWGDGGYSDAAPDDGSWPPISLAFDPHVTPGTFSFAETDGDGVVEAGETVLIQLSLLNEGLDATGTQLTAVANLAAASSAPATLNVDSVVYGGGAALAGGGEASSDEPFQVAVGGEALPGHRLELALLVTDDAGHQWELAAPAIVVGYPAEIPLTTLLADADDTGDALDIAAVRYSVTAGEMVFLIDTHGPHTAEAEVDLFLDVDLDGGDDYRLSTLDPDTGAMTGRLFEARENDWAAVGYPATFNYSSGNETLAMGVPLSRIGDPPYTRIHAQSYTTAFDQAPDAYAWAPNRPVACAVESPLLGLGAYSMSDAVGDGDVHLEPGEEWTLEVQATNYGMVAAEDVAGTLLGVGGGITLLASLLEFGEIPPGEAAWAIDPIRFRVDEGTPPATQYLPELWAIAAGYPMGDVSVADPVAIGVGVLPGDSVATAPAIEGTINLLYGDSRLFTDTYSDPSMCTGWPANGNDAVYGLLMTTGMQLIASAIYQTYPPDASIYISDDEAHPDLSCLAGSDVLFGNSQEVLNFAAPADGLYYLVVDAYETGGGPFELSLIFY